MACYLLCMADLAARLCARALGLTLSCSNAIDHVSRAQRESAIDQHGAQLVLWARGFRAVSSERSCASRFCSTTKQNSCSPRNCFHFCVERESRGCACSRAAMPSFGEDVERFANRRVAAADGNYAELALRAALDDRLRDELRRCFVLVQQAVHHFLVFVRNFGIAAEFVVAGAAREERTLWDARRAACARAT